MKGGDYRAREANVYRLAEVSNNIIDQCVAQGVPFAREYGGIGVDLTAAVHGREGIVEEHGALLEGQHLALTGADVIAQAQMCIRDRLYIAL